MKKLKPENYEYLLHLTDDINNYVTRETIELEDKRLRDERYQKEHKEYINSHRNLSKDLIELLLSKDENAFVANLIELQSYGYEILDYWFQTKCDKYLELFELVETNEEIQDVKPLPIPPGLCDAHPVDEDGQELPSANELIEHIKTISGVNKELINIEKLES